MPGATPFRLLLWLTGFGPWVFPARGDNPLAHVEAFVIRTYPTVPQLLPAELAAALASACEPPVLFDVRTPSEFAAGHLAGAIRIDPDISGAEFHRRHGASIAGRRQVFYCSVGLRSSRLLQRLEVGTSHSGRRASCNLRGGIFRWDNEGLPVVGDGGATGKIHPYGAFWKRFSVRFP